MVLFFFIHSSLIFLLQMLSSSFTFYSEIIVKINEHKKNWGNNNRNVWVEKCTWVSCGSPPASAICEGTDRWNTDTTTHKQHKELTMKKQQTDHEHTKVQQGHRQQTGTKDIQQKTQKQAQMTQKQHADTKRRQSGTKWKGRNKQGKDKQQLWTANNKKLNKQRSGKHRTY